MTTPRDPTAEALRSALAAEPKALDEDALLARALDRAMAKTESPVVEAPVVTATAGLRALRAADVRRRSRMLRVALPLAAAFAASLAMGAVYMVYRTPAAPSKDVQHTELPSTAPATTGGSKAATPSAPVVAEGAPTISVDDLPNAAKVPAAPHGSLGPAAPAAPVDTSATPAELFRDANAARRSGDVGGAVDLYKKLVTQHAGTPEAHAARVSLGRLLLDRQGDTAGALAQFDAYLRSGSSDRSLAEEARLGRALVFQRQGRTEEERRAWQELLDRHPDSLHAARARERLRALSPESAPTQP